MTFMPTALTVVLAMMLPAFAGASEKKSIVLIVADDLGMDLGCFGASWMRTPNLDALAANGTRFTQAFATVASCSPSRAVLLSGLYTHTNGQYGLAHAEHHAQTFESVRSLPKRLKQAGYRTGVIGKLHVLPEAVYPFDLNVGGGKLGGGRDVRRFADAVKQFILHDTEPFFLLVGFSDPHRAGKGFANARDAGNPYDPGAMTVPAFLPDDPEIRKDLADYAQSVSRLDRGVGLVLDAIKAANAADNTLVIFLSDNGSPFPGAKTNLYDAGVHLPLIVSSPTQTRRGQANDAMVSWVDITPTVLDWAGVKSDDLPGRSVLNLLDADHGEGRDVVFGSHVQHEVTMYYPMRSIRTRHHKYILNLASGLEFPTAGDIFGSPTWQTILRKNEMGSRDLAKFLNRPREELYDLEKDPNELKNVAAEPAYAGMLAELREKLKDWQKRTNDPWLVKYNHE
jgi:N-sulfoglucosamine sulfohydrolase